MKRSPKGNARNGGETYGDTPSGHKRVIFYAAKRRPKGNARGWWCDIWGRVSGVTQRSGVRREDAGPVPMCCTLARTKKVDTPSGAQVSIKKLTFKVRPLLSYLRYAAQRRAKGNARDCPQCFSPHPKKVDK